MALENAYITLAEMKSALDITDNVDDTQLELAINTGSRDIDQFCGRNFYNNGTATRVFAATDNICTDIDDLISLTTLETSGNADGVFDQTWTSTDYQLEPLNGRTGGLTGWPYTRIRAVSDVLFPMYQNRATVRVTGVWGWSAVPSAIKTATLLQSIRLFKRPDAPYGIAGFGDIGISRISSRLDPDVQQAIAAYRLMRAIG